jgi:hypothetical protein
MRSFLALGLVMVACKGEPPRGPTLVSRVPHVDKLDVVAAEPPDTLPPPLVVVVDGAGKLGVTAGPAKWSALATYAPPQALRTIEVALLESLVMESAGLGTRARDNLGSLDQRARDRAGAARSHDELPPPEPPDDGPDDVEPTQRMVRNKEVTETTSPARTSARGRYSGLDGGFKYETAGTPPPGNPSGWWPRPMPPLPPGHLVSVIGEPIANVVATQAVVAADPEAKASAMVDAIAAAEGSVLVEVSGALRVRTDLAAAPQHDRDVYSPRPGAGDRAADGQARSTRRAAAGRR